MITRIDRPRNTIKIPAYLTKWDLSDVLHHYLLQIDRPNSNYVLNMADVKNIYSATAHLIFKLYDRACRLGCSMAIVNASEPVQNALRNLEIHKKMPVYGELN